MVLSEVGHLLQLQEDNTEEGKRQFLCMCSTSPHDPERQVNRQ